MSTREHDLPIGSVGRRVFEIDEKYLELCRKVRLGDRSLIEDQHFQSEGGQVFYAIDFVELFSFIHVGENIKNITYLPIKGPGWRENSIAFNEMLMAEILLSGRYPLILLPPHQLELRKHVAAYHAYEASELSQIIEQLHTKKDDLKRKLVKTASAAAKIKLGKNLSDMEIREIVEEIDESSPALLLLARLPKAKPLSRLRQLNRRLKFRSVREVISGGQIPTPYDLDDRFFRTCLDALNDIRPTYPDASNRADAYALAYLKYCNEFSGRRKRVRLVTRSEALHTLHQRLVDRGLWPDSPGFRILRPRLFATYIVARVTSRNPTEMAADRLNKIETLLGSVSLGEAFSSDASNRGFGRELEEALQEIRERWLELENLVIAAGISDGSIDTADVRPATWGADVGQLLRFIDDEEDLHAAIADRAKEVVLNINSGHVDVASLVVSHGAKSEELVTKAIHFDERTSVLKKKRDGGKNLSAAPIVLRSKQRQMPFTLFFYDRRIGKLIRGGSDENTALLRYVQKRGVGSDYEKRLALAFLLAAMDHWPLALNYCDAAVTSPDKEDDSPRHEAYYFRAACRRLSESWTKDAVASSLRDLRIAHDIRSFSMGIDEYRDPRYLNEEGVQIRIAVELFGEDFSRGLNLPDASVKWVEALSITHDDFRLRMAILNNLCYLNVRQCRNIGSCGRDAEKYYGEIVEILADNNLTLDDISPSIAHTLLWAQWCLGSQVRPIVPKSTILQELEKLKEFTPMNEHERQTIIEDLNCVRASSA